MPVSDRAEWNGLVQGKGLLGQTSRMQPKCSFLLSLFFCYFHFSYLLSNSSFKFKPLLTSNIHQQLQHVSNYITLFIYCFLNDFIEHNIKE
jgi:hypothetical protein